MRSTPRARHALAALLAAAVLLGFGALSGAVGGVALAHPQDSALDGDHDTINSPPVGDDNCPDDANRDQLDTDGDTQGDACDTDDDDDGVLDESDNCTTERNPGQNDTDDDGDGDTCDTDDDNDQVRDASDNCRLQVNPDQADADRDKIGDACDPDARPSVATPPPTAPGDTGGALDREPPQVGLSVARRHRLPTLGAGLTAPVTCSEACAVAAELIVDTTWGRRLGLPATGGPVPLGQGTAELQGAGRTYAFVRLSSRVRARLARHRRVPATLVVRFTDRGGNTRLLERRVTIARR